jgi:hypothetical protein
MENELRLEFGMNLLLKDDVVNGFSYSFSLALLKKLQQLKKDNKLFWNGNIDPTQEGAITDMAATIMGHLSGQISRHGHVLRTDSSQSSNQVNAFILFVEEFLAIFPTKAKKTK